MPVYFTTPAFARAGVIAGFVLEVPVYWGVAEAGSGPVTFPLYNADRTVGAYTYHIATGFTHTVTVGPRTYSYVQQSGDSVGTIAQALANAINGAGDPDATATWSTTALTLTARADTGAVVALLADGMWTGTLVELAGGTPLVPLLSKGVLFAQGTMYRPTTAPALTAAPASQQSWLFYSSTSGFYWHSTSTPVVSDDALIGWVVANAAMIIACSSRRLGTGEEAIIQAGATALSVDTAVSGDTGAPTEGPGFAVATVDTGFAGETTPGLLWLGDVGLPGANVAGVSAVTFLLYYIDELAGKAAPLWGTLTSGATSLTLPTLVSLPVAAPQAISFTFSPTTVGGVVIGPGYVHNITIGAASYSYVQGTSDTAADIASALAAAIDAAVNTDALAVAAGAVVTLTPLGSGGGTVSCTASDGNAAASLHETQPSYYLIGSEIIEVQAADGSAIARGQLGSTATAHAIGDAIWQVQTMARFDSLPGALGGTAAWPVMIEEVPFRGRALVAADCWVTNEYGDSPVTQQNYSTTIVNGRLRAFCGGQIDLMVDGVLGVQSDAVTGATLAQAASVRSISATVLGAPVGAAIMCVVKVAGNTIGTLAILDGAVVSNTIDMLSTMGSGGNVDGIVIPAGAQVSLDVTSVGSTYPGKRLTVTVRL